MDCFPCFSSSEKEAKRCNRRRDSATARRDNRSSNKQRHIAPDTKPLDWSTRMKIASGAAKGLEYLHDKADPPVIYRDLKASNILLDEQFNPKLSDFGLAKIGTVGDKVLVSSRVMGTYGFCAPKCAKTGELTLKSDVYSFGVVLLELITGRRAMTSTDILRNRI